ncbi:hypothetical protein JZ751_020142 [Albula glossodonta]|uniref:Uncharacterized protein n=1 Tax=Albula glossodonta TaxID=121402 RepID=A0A8T2NL35_9TELE|nr:hypothetical protein JZ751_020142 [Albula glossodonta]
MTWFTTADQKYKFSLQQRKAESTTTYRWIWKRSSEETEKHLLLKHKEIMEDERQWYKKIILIKDVKENLLDRQNIFCSSTIHHSYREELEKKLLELVRADPMAKKLQMEADVRDIFQKDTSCAGLLNKDKAKNGSILWKYLERWENKADQQKRFKVSEMSCPKVYPAPLGEMPQPPRSSGSDHSKSHMGPWIRAQS